MASRVRGVKRIRRLFKALPDAVRTEMVGVLERGGRSLVAAMRARAPSRTGALRRGIIYRVFPKTLRLRAGLIGTPRGRAKLFYGRIQDVGRKAQVVSVQRRKIGVNSGLSGGRKIRRDIAASYQMRVRAMPAKRFVTGRMPEIRKDISRHLRGIWDRALRKISGGGLD